MAANLTDRLWSWGDIIVLINKAEIEALQAKRLAVLNTPQSN